jgi:hypothetical protein
MSLTIYSTLTLISASISLTVGVKAFMMVEISSIPNIFALDSSSFI